VTSGAYRYGIVGAGPMGSAAARHLSETAGGIVLVGPPEPAATAAHHGVFASHYDETRIAHVLENAFIASLLAARSMRRFADLEARTGITFHRRHPSLTVAPAVPRTGTGEIEQHYFDLDAIRANALDVGVVAETLDEAALRRSFPRLRFPPGHHGLLQHDAAIVNPRAFVRAQIAAAVANGVHLVPDEVTRMTRRGTGFALATRGGDILEVEQVLVATGGFTNACGLLGSDLAYVTLGATDVLVETDQEADLLPCLMYAKDDGPRSFGGYAMPPTTYPDGRRWIKGATASMVDNPLDGYDAIGEWFRGDGFVRDADEFRTMLADLLPDVALGPARTKACLVTFTATFHPYIDIVDDGLAIAVGGNGWGVMTGDEIGRLAARLVRDGAWGDPLPASLFAARFASSVRSADPTSE
jgi:sarcosine oxidase